MNASQVAVGLDLITANTEIEDILRSAASFGSQFLCLPLLVKEGDNGLQDRALWDFRTYLKPDSKHVQSLFGRVSFVGRHSGASKTEIPNQATPSPSAAGRNALRELHEALQRQIAWASYIGLPAIIVDLADMDVDTCRSICHMSTTISQTQILVQLRLDSTESTWSRWNSIRQFCGGLVHFGLILEVTEDIPNDHVLDQWFAEPVKMILIHHHVFASNTRGYPVLTRAHQNMVKRFLHVCKLITIAGLTSVELESTMASNHVQYVKHLVNDSSPFVGGLENLLSSYNDLLQAPLQPLRDNLDSATYEMFEKDPAKYRLYEDAIYKALIDFQETAILDRTFIVAVVGAGRGPLIESCLQASYRSRCRIQVYGLEKNPNAFLILQSKKAQVWGDRVNLVFGDVRTTELDIRADLIVSELLGSLGDNELSPECLESAERFMKEGGLSIPCSYRAYVAPIFAPRLYEDCAATQDNARFEKPYVVKMKQVHLLGGPANIWEFSHGQTAPVAHTFLAREVNLHNERRAAVEFDIDHETVVHGIAGYFDATLYNNAQISIVPSTHTEGMFSWFPLYFPLQTPMQVPAKAKVTLKLWRRTDSHRVWYEWAASWSHPALPTVFQSVLHNSGGRSSWIDLHSR